VLEKSIKGMLPKGPLGRELFTKLKIYKGPEHPHKAQNPTQITVH
jgi:large subunit ribosomal protein L13